MIAADKNGHFVNGLFFVFLVWVGVDLGACEVFVSEKHLDGPHVSDTHKTAGKGMTKDVRVNRAPERFPCRPVYDPLHLAGCD